jgi:hypothetical protein
MGVRFGSTVGRSGLGGAGGGKPFSLASATSTWCTNAVSGWAPIRRSPLMKKVGVPVMSASLASFRSASTRGRNFALSSAARNFGTSRFRARACSSSAGRSRRSCPANRRSCISQNLPCSPAASAASAGQTGGLVERQRQVLPDQADLIGVRFSSSRSVGTTRAQNGHWNSLYETMVMGALGFPRAGESPGSNALRRASALSTGGSARAGTAPASAGVAAGGGAAPGAAGVPAGAAGGATARRGTLDRGVRVWTAPGARSLATGEDGVSLLLHHRAAAPIAAAVTAAPASFHPPARPGSRASCDRRRSRRTHPRLLSLPPLQRPALHSPPARPAGPAPLATAAGPGHNVRPDRPGPGPGHVSIASGRFPPGMPCRRAISAGSISCA